MSTTARSSLDSQSGGGGGGGRRADRGPGEPRYGPGRRADRSPRTSQRQLTGRALRVRNAFVRHAAVRLGLPAPTAAELRDLPGDAGLGEAVEWWRARAPGALEVVESRTGIGFALRTALIMGVTLVGLALSYGRAQ
jgi:hypothetical protein